MLILFELVSNLCVAVKPHFIETCTVLAGWFIGAVS